MLIVDGIGLRISPVSESVFTVVHLPSQVQEALDDKAKSLGSPWDAERVRKALWSCAMHSRFGLSVAVSTRGEAIVDSDAHAGKEEQDCAETVDGSEERSKRHKSRR